jgi:hypothetical protein
VAANDVGTTQSADQTFRTLANGLIVAWPPVLLPLTLARPGPVDASTPSTGRRAARF